MEMMKFGLAELVKKNQELDPSYKIPSSLLLQPIKEGANPAVANIHKKRFCLSQEPDKTKKNMHFYNERINWRLNYQFKVFIF